MLRIIKMYLDFNVLCFTETHLSNAIETNSLMFEGFDKIYRKYLTNHSGGLLVYVASSLISRRMPDLEILLPESIWVEITDRNHAYLICNVYRQPHQTNEFWDRINICLERASELSERITLVGDINEDQLILTNNKFRTLMMLNKYGEYYKRTDKSYKANTNTY